jgi:ABC-type transport system involved in cytochrome c biogenesis permease subunit
LVEVQTEGEQKAALLAAVGIVVLGIAAVAAGLLLDPMGGY